jgi:hypothetical protein
MPEASSQKPLAKAQHLAIYLVSQIRLIFAKPFS